MTFGPLTERVTRLDCRIEPYDWPFPHDEAPRIDSHWDDLCRQRPRLFNGRVLLAHRLSIEPVDGGALIGGCFETSFKSFIGWRDFGHPGIAVFNLFAMPALRASDGAFMLGEMSAGTANAGRLYFPAGTPEPADADASGHVDFEANILRELEEETGLRPDEVTLDAGWTIVFDGPRVACMRVVQAPYDADTLQSRLTAFNATNKNPELDRLVPVRTTHDFDAKRMPSFMLRYLTGALRLP